MNHENYTFQLLDIRDSRVETLEGIDSQVTREFRALISSDTISNCVN